MSPLVLAALWLAVDLPVDAAAPADDKPLAPSEVAFIVDFVDNPLDSPFDVLTPVRIERLDGSFAHVRSGPMVLLVDDDKQEPFVPEVFSEKTTRVAVSTLAHKPPTTLLLKRQLARAKRAFPRDEAGIKHAQMRLWWFDPSDDDVPRELSAALAQTLKERQALYLEPLLESAVLTYGCRGDLSRARTTTQTLTTLTAKNEAIDDDRCAVHVDVREPCLESNDPLNQQLVARHRAMMSTLVARYPHAGPTMHIRMQHSSTRKTYLHTALLETVACETDQRAELTSSKAIRLRIPLLLKPATLVVPVPRYEGIVAFLADDLDDEIAGELTFIDAFHASAADAHEDDENQEPALAPHTIVSAPSQCGCLSDMRSE